MLNIRWPGTAVSDRHVVASVAKGNYSLGGYGNGIIFHAVNYPAGVIICLASQIADILP